MAHRTRQRKAVQEVFDSADGPLLPEEILELAQPRCPTLGAATVYRTLRLLRERGAIREVVMPDQRVRFENVGPHHCHFHCRVCDRVFDVPGCRTVGSPRESRIPGGFRVEGRKVLLRGVCAVCR